jgi:transcriptional regulator with XRE-family HTH domain
MSAQDWGQRIKALREQKGWSRRRLAREANLSPTSISLYERGLQTPRVSTLKSIADALGVPIHALVDTEQLQADLEVLPVQEDILDEVISGSIWAGKPWAISEEDGEKRTIKEYLRLRHPLAAIVAGESLCPLAQHGDVVILEPINERPKDGELVVALTADGWTAKRVACKSKGVFLEPINGGPSLPAAGAIIAYRIVAIIRRTTR